MSTRLSTNVLGLLPEHIARPSYERASIKAGIVHLGVGAFHRAHQAIYMDDLLGQNPDWGIVGASLRRPDTRDALAPQDFLYTLAVRDASGTKCRIVGALLDCINVADKRENLLGVMAAPATRIISLTITEKGYCHDPATGELDENHPDIVHDLARPAEPVSAPGLVVEATRLRRDNGAPPFAIMSCDNLPANGETARKIITRFAWLCAPELGEYVEKNIAFPSTMVDRIVPATTDADRAEISQIIGVEDAWPIVTEPFCQWVVEDNFPSGRPPFEQAGAQMVADVEPFERMKLRMLNGAHSALAYLGYLAGFKTVSDVVSNKKMLAFLHELMSKEIIPTLHMPGIDLLAYRDELLTRFANPSLKHATWQIAMDGSQKLPQRLLDTIRDRIGAGASYDRLALGVAGWIVYASGTDESGESIEISDPLAREFERITASAGNDAAALVDGFLRLKAVFGAQLPEDRNFRWSLEEKVRLLRERGVLMAIG